MQPEGLFSHTASLFGAKLAYVRARLQLAGLEGKEAGIHFAIIVGLVAGALVLGVLGYLFFVIAAVFLVAWLCGGGNAWIWVTFAAALGHLIVAVALLFIAKSRLSQPVFAATLAEFKHDQEWLKTHENPS
jgi:uncharacterized membrane protein YqjE